MSYKQGLQGQFSGVTEPGDDCPPNSVPAMWVVLRPPGRAPYAVTVDRLTAHVRAVRMLRTMGRLADKLSRANDAIANVEIAVEKDVDALIDRTRVVDAKRAEVFMQKHMNLD